MVLVRSHYPPDAVAAARGVESGGPCPVAGDLKEDLGPGGVQESAVAGGLSVPPDVVGDGGAHMPLEPGAVGQPAS